MNKQADFVKFVTLLTGIADYYGKELSEGVISLYWQGLQQYDLKAVEKALWEHTQNPDSGQFMPKIADVTRGLAGRTTDQAALAWSKVDGAVRRVGTYSDVVFDDPVIHRVIADMGGWIKFGTQTEDEWPFVSNQFQTRYRGYKLRGEVPEYQPVLIGMSNAYNGKEGFKSQPPMLIGDEAKAKQVLLAGTNEQLIQMRLASDSITDGAIKRIGTAA
ncbi:DUF6475 domain-containing protein [Undibacterium arcticum]|uniref:DUF6475 domain-containing protein n=1 Tax=Undibacterium arcticum TaxID=1762892 RepID=A0ABV7F1E9_9BURK